MGVADPPHGRLNPIDAVGKSLTMGRSGDGMVCCRAPAILAAILLLLASGTAQGRRLSYEIGGVIYTYETRNREEVLMARDRMAVASSAAEARARATAEAASNPFVKIFGSETQRFATEAEAELERTLAITSPAPSMGAPRPAPQQSSSASAVKPPSTKPGKFGAGRKGMVNAAAVEQFPNRASRGLPAKTEAKEPAGARHADQLDWQVVRQANLSRHPHSLDGPPDPSSEVVGDTDTTGAITPASWARTGDGEASLINFVEQVRGKAASEPVAAKSNQDNTPKSVTSIWTDLCRLLVFGRC
jgi:hypothetical protein